MNAKPKILLLPPEADVARIWERYFLEEVRYGCHIWVARDVDDAIDLLADDSAAEPTPTLLVAGVPNGFSLHEFTMLAQGFKTRHPHLKVALVAAGKVPSAGAEPETPRLINSDGPFDYILWDVASFDVAARAFLDAVLA